MYTEGFGEVLTDILTVNPELSSVSSASAVLDTSNYTFQAVTFGKDADGFNHHAHTVYTSSSIPEGEPYKHLVIFAGQSNMNGVGNDDGGRDLFYRENYGRPAHNVNYWNIETSSFDTYVDPSANTSITSRNIPIAGSDQQGVDTVYNPAGGNFGPELQFARNLENDGIQDVYLFKFALNGSFLVPIEGSELHKMFGRDLVDTTTPAGGLAFALSMGLLAVPTEGIPAVASLYEDYRLADKEALFQLYLNNWNPSGAALLNASGNPYRAYNRFADHCRAIIDNLGENTIKTVTFIWAQGEQETYQAQKTSNQYVSGYSAACSYLIDEVSSIFSGAESFYPIRSKVNSVFASGYEGSYQYYPQGYYSKIDTNTKLNECVTFDQGYKLFADSDKLSNFPVQYFKYPRTFVGAALPGDINIETPDGQGIFFGYTGSDLGRPYVPELQEQQEAMDTNKYGPLLDFDDLSGAMLNSGSSTSFSALSGAGEGQTIREGATMLTYNVTAPFVDGYTPPDPEAKEFANLNFHYNDYALTEIGERFYNKWIELVDPPKVGLGVSSYNDRVVVARNYSNDDAPFASSYNISSTYLQLSTTYNSVPNYPNPKDERLERGSTLNTAVSGYQSYSSLDDLGHYVNGGLGKTSDIWNVAGGFPPSGYQNWDYFILSSTDSIDSGTDIRDLTYSTGLAASGELSGVFNADEVMDVNGFLKISPLSGIGEQLSALGTHVSGSAFSGGALVFSSTDNQAVKGIANVAVRLKDGDAASVALFGGLNHIGVWCLDMKAMREDGLRPPFSWDNLDNIRRYKLVSKVSFWDNLLTHKDNSGQSGMEVLAADPNGDFKFGGPTFLLKFKFT